MSDHRQILIALADDLRAIAELPPIEASQRLAGMLSTTSDERVTRRVAQARQAAVAEILGTAGTMYQVSKLLQIDAGTVSRILRGAMKAR